MVFLHEPYATPLSHFLSCTDGIIRTRYRDSTSTPSLVEPGRAYGYTIDLWATSNVFKAGHRIRVEVSSSNFPRFDRNPNTGSGLPRTPNAHRVADHPAQRAVPLPYHAAHRATIRGSGRGMPQGLIDPALPLDTGGGLGRAERERLERPASERWSLVMPRRLLLVGVGHREHGHRREGVAGDLQADGERGAVREGTGR